ncbi:unnamed protein product [Microthlaspi erraticum]|uniref:F-box domain-containing protein n=1 Tax=Microthlaspi erraticum TaxID=1685480 RepID=A0A6D2I2S9_9BRAS|nr:unnamed protein product [Microthlaspi erraticum]
MDSSGEAPDRLSSLPNVLLVMIISSLSFKECVSTSSISRRFRNLYRETTNISFKESEFVTHRAFSGLPRMVARILFVRYMHEWVSRMPDHVIQSFEIHLPCPFGFGAEIASLIAFAVSRQVKKLVLDFSNPAWRSFHDARRLPLLVHLPACVYSLKTLESLKLYACGFDPSRFQYPEMLRSLHIGCVRLINFEPLLRRCSKLDILSISHCWGLDLMNIAGDMREFAFNNCDFPFIACFFNLPKVDVFKYAGDINCLEFDRMNAIIKEVHLDFGLLGGYDGWNKETVAEGGMVCDLLNKLRDARTLTVCPYLIQVIQESEHPEHFLCPMKTQHLVLNTKLHPREFNGISLLLHNSPDLEKVTFDMISPSPYPFTTSTYGGIDSRTYWLKDTTYECLKTLKVVVVRNFCGGSNELDVLMFFIRSGRGSGSDRERGDVLELIEIYLPNELDKTRLKSLRFRAERVQHIARPIQVLVHDP